ncbi:MAG: DUF4079 family protein [Candidatus Binatia bacterium]
MGGALAYLHPIVGGAVTALAVWTASLGLRGRRPVRRAATFRAHHRTVAPWMYAAMLASWAGGLLSTVWLRDDLEASESGHFAVGCAVVALYTAAGLLSRRLDDVPWARAVHPWLGAAGVLLAGVQVFLGLQIMPH